MMQLDLTTICNLFGNWNLGHWDLFEL